VSREAQSEVRWTAKMGTDPEYSGESDMRLQGWMSKHIIVTSQDKAKVVDQAGIHRKLMVLPREISTLATEWRSQPRS